MNDILSSVIYHVVKRGYNSNSYAAARASYIIPREPDDFFEKFVKSLGVPEPAVLDIGCGAGIPIDDILCRNGCSVHGIDISEKQISRAINNVPQASYEVCNFMTMDSTAKYDGIVCSYMLFHIPVWQQSVALRKMKSMLNPNGIILITVRVTDSYLLRYLDKWYGAPMFWSYGTYKQTLSKLNKQGLHAFVYSPSVNKDYTWLYLKRCNCKEV